jgi:hypothetical protein
MHMLLLAATAAAAARCSFVIPAAAVAAAARTQPSGCPVDNVHWNSALPAAAAKPQPTTLPGFDIYLAMLCSPTPVAAQHGLPLVLCSCCCCCAAVAAKPQSSTLLILSKRSCRDTLYNNRTTVRAEEFELTPVAAQYGVPLAQQQLLSHIPGALLGVRTDAAAAAAAEGQSEANSTCR